jgi:hypothetical protein
MKLVVMVAGRYSAPTAEERAANLRTMNDAAVAVARRGHVPVIGVNAALPVLACLQIARSPGADREAEAIRSLGRPVFTAVEALPQAQ